MNINIERAINFVFEDPRWKEKTITGTLLVLISTVLSVVLIGVIGFLIVTGWCVRLLQNVRDGHAHPLPEWDQWGDDLVRGFKLVVVTLVWALPALIFAIPTAIGSAIAADGSDVAAAMGSTIIFCATCLISLYSLAVTVLMPGFTIAFARDEQISSGLAVREIWDWTVANIGPVVLVTIIYLAASAILPLLGFLSGLILLCVGWIVTIPLAVLAIYVVQYHLYGQLARLYPMGSTIRAYDDVPPSAPSSEPAVEPPAEPPAAPTTTEL